MRERRPGYEIYVVPVVVAALGGGIKALKVDLKKIFNNNKTVRRSGCNDAKNSPNGQ